MTSIDSFEDKLIERFKLKYNVKQIVLLRRDVKQFLIEKKQNKMGFTMSIILILFSD